MLGKLLCRVGIHKWKPFWRVSGADMNIFEPLGAEACERHGCHAGRAFNVGGFYTYFRAEKLEP